MPFLHNLAIARRSDVIRSLGGILNGTTNYMLDAMQRLHLDYADVLADAQRLGYAEADPTADVSGLDALRKIMLACAVAYGTLPTDGLLNEGIESVTAADVAHFQSRGYTCRLIASGGREGDPDLGNQHALHIQTDNIHSQPSLCRIMDKRLFTVNNIPGILSSTPCNFMKSCYSL